MIYGDTGAIWDKNLVDTIHQEVTSSYNINNLVKAPGEAGNSHTFHEYIGNNHVDESINYDKYQDGIKAYTGTAYSKINKMLRSGTKVQHEVLTFLRYAKENFKGGVYRGTRLTDTQLQQLETMKPGDLLSNLSPLSTSTSKAQAGAFIKNISQEQKANPTVLTIIGSGHDISKHSKYSTEDEVLLKPGKAFELVSKTKTGNGITSIVLREVNKKDIPKGKKVNKSLLTLPIGAAFLGADREEGN